MGILWDGTGKNCYGMGQMNMSHGQPWRFPLILTVKFHSLYVKELDSKILERSELESGSNMLPPTPQLWVHVSSFLAGLLNFRRCIILHIFPLYWFNSSQHQRTQANLLRGECDIDLQWTQCFTGLYCANQSLSHTYIYEETSLSLV